MIQGISFQRGKWLVLLLNPSRCFSAFFVSIWPSCILDSFGSDDIKRTHKMNPVEFHEGVVSPVEYVISIWFKGY